MSETLDDYFHRARWQRDGRPFGGHIDRHRNAGRERAFEQFVWPHARVELLIERGVVITYEMVRFWCDELSAGFARCAKSVRRKPGSTWHLDEILMTLCGEPYLLWCAVDARGAELAMLIQKRRDTAAAKRFFRRVLRSNPVPRYVERMLSAPQDGHKPLK